MIDPDRNRQRSSFNDFDDAAVGGTMIDLFEKFSFPRGRRRSWSGPWLCTMRRQLCDADDVDTTLRLFLCVSCFVFIMPLTNSGERA